MIKRAIISSSDNDLITKLNALDFKIIFTKKSTLFNDLECLHPDMQVNIIDNNLYTLNDFVSYYKLNLPDYNVISNSNIIKPQYPYCIALNALVIGKYIIGNQNYIDKSIINYADINDYKIIHTNQGYARCSTCILNDSSAITEDESIFNTLTELNIDVLLINKGYINLDGADYGFIGGASGKIDNDTILFNGDITLHPDYIKIKKFCDKYKINLEYIKNKKLNDVGGIVVC